jgi:hypothetical protein
MRRRKLHFRGLEAKNDLLLSSEELFCRDVDWRACELNISWHFDNSAHCFRIAPPLVSNRAGRIMLFAAEHATYCYRMTHE